MGKIVKVSLIVAKVIALMVMCIALGMIFLFLPILTSYFMKFPNCVGIPLTLGSMVAYLIVLQYIYDKAFNVYK